MLAGASGCDRHFGMQMMRRRDDDGVNPRIAEKRPPVGVRRAAVICREGFRETDIVRADGSDFDARGYLNGARVEFAEEPGSENADADHLSPRMV
jgi:hypothetical protein